MTKTEDMEELKKKFIKGCKDVGMDIEEIGASIYCGTDNDKWLKIPAPRATRGEERGEAKLVLVEGSATIKNPTESEVEDRRLTVKNEDGESLSLY